MATASYTDSYKTITFIVADPDAPTILGLKGDQASWQGSPSPIDHNIDATVNYSANPSLNGGYLRINASFIDAGETLSVQNQGAGAGQIGVAGATVTYEGLTIGAIDATDNGATKALRINFTTMDATPTAVAALLRSILYHNSAAQPTLGARAVTTVLSDGTLSNNYTSAVMVVENSAPLFTSTPVTAAQEDAAYSYNVTASDADGDSVAITAPTLPSWLTLNDHGEGAATLSGTPGNSEVGEHEVALQVSDGSGELLWG